MNDDKHYKMMIASKVRFFCKVTFKKNRQSFELYRKLLFDYVTTTFQKELKVLINFSGVKSANLFYDFCESVMVNYLKENNLLGKNNYEIF